MEYATQYIVYNKTHLSIKEQKELNKANKHKKVNHLKWLFNINDIRMNLKIINYGFLLYYLCY